MQESFQIALKTILEKEGYFEADKGELNDPNDSGGFTIAGVTVQNFTDFFKLPHVADPHNPPEELKAQMRAMTEAHLGPYYKHFKWDDIRGDQLPPGVDLAVADVCTLHGPGKARQFLRRALGLGESMAPLHDDVIHAVWADTVDWDHVIQSIAQSRLDHYLRIIAAHPGKAKFKKGWFNRTHDVTAKCCAMAPDRHHGSGDLHDHGRAHELEAA